jgi:hypothetical protein
MKNIIAYFITDFKHWKKIDFFKRLLYGFLFINTLSLLPIANDIFGYNGLAGSKGFIWNGSESFLNLLSHPINHKNEWIHWVFIIGQLIFLILGFFRIKPWLSSISIWFFTVNLFLKGALFLTGGEALVNLILFYLIFIQKTDKESKNYLRQNTINNTFYIMLLIQICVLYFFSTFWKLFDDNWISGHALYYISQIESFSSDWMYTIFKDNLWLSKAVTYAVLFYQGSFAFIVWIKKIKVPFLILGTFFHITISIGMGIFTFGIIMSLSYILFLEERHIDWMKQFVSKTRN